MSKEETRPLLGLEMRKKIVEYLEEVRTVYYTNHPAALKYRPGIVQKGINLTLEALLEM